MDFYIDLIVYILAIIGLIITNIALLESYTVSVQKKCYILNKEIIKKRYFIKKEKNNVFIF